jgi:YfiH family protein
LAEALHSALLDRVAHGFMTRRGGVSTGEVAGLQCGFGAGDDEADVAENRRLAVEAVLPGAPLVTPYQVHSPDAVVVSQPWAWENRPKADAVVTDRPGLLLGIVTADCAPVLLADRDAGVVGAAHAGWRGAHGGVIEATVEAMLSLGAERDCIVAAIGPCIAQSSYEVDEGFRGQFADGDDGKFFVSGRKGHWQFDLEAYVGKRLAAAGVEHVDPLSRDTYREEVSFYSFRRATHRSEASYGRQLSLIGIAG